VKPRLFPGRLCAMLFACACLAPAAATAQTWRSFPSDARAYAARPGRALPHEPVKTAGTYVAEVGPSGPAGTTLPPGHVSTYGPYRLEPGKRYLAVIRTGGLVLTEEDPSVQAYARPAGAQVYVRNEAGAGEFYALRFVMADPRCTAVTGTWRWVNDQQMVITVDGRFEVRQNGAAVNRGDWQCSNPLTRTFILTHDRGGWIDRVKLSADGNALEGSNQAGEEVKSTRMK
jgi:hypothetical protein